MKNLSQTICKCLLAVLFFCQLSMEAHAQDTIYVNDDAIGANNGSSWTDAYTNFGDAFTSINQGDEIWVAKGNYTTTVPAQYGGCINLSVFMRDGIRIYGSLDVNEDPHVDTRDFDANSSIIESVAGKAHLNFSQVDPNAPLSIIDGFRFVGEGDGVHIASGQLEMHNCEFEEMETSSVLAIEGGEVSIYNTVFAGNQIFDLGAVVMANNESDVYFENCWFKENEVFAPVTLFSGILLSTASSEVDFTNCIFVSNEAYNAHALRNNGSGSFWGYSDVTLTNCTFADNSNAATDGETYYGDINVYNTIMFEDEDMDFVDALATDLSLEYSVVPSGYSGLALVQSDPQLAGSDYELCSTSPALNAGYNGFNTTSLDIDGDTRIPTGTTIDIGAHEGSVACPTPFQEQVSTPEIAVSHISVYPNPVNQQLFFQLPNKASSAQLIDAQGRVLLSKVELSEGLHAFDLSGFDDGIYILAIETPSHTERITVVKNH